MGNVGRPHTPASAGLCQPLLASHQFIPTRIAHSMRSRGGKRKRNVQNCGLVIRARRPTLRPIPPVLTPLVPPSLDRPRLHGGLPLPQGLWLCLRLLPRRLLRLIGMGSGPKEEEPLLPTTVAAGSADQPPSVWRGVPDPGEPYTAAAGLPVLLS